LTVTPYLIVSAGAEAIEFYKRAFEAVERNRMEDSAGKIHHAEIDIGNSRVMLADENPEVGGAEARDNGSRIAARPSVAIFFPGGASRG
jgi:PhnB protein